MLKVRAFFLLSCGFCLLSSLGCDDDDDDSIPPTVTPLACNDCDEDGYDNLGVGGDDCDDTDSNINPGAQEVCDEADNNCDGEIDEGVLMRYFEDSDGDNYGNPDVFTDACIRPQEYVANEGDCNDADASISPQAEEVCDPQDVDEDCDLLADDADHGVTETTA